MWEQLSTARKACCHHERGVKPVYLWVCEKKTHVVSAENDISFLRAQSGESIMWFTGTNSREMRGCFPHVPLPPTSLSFCDMHVKAGLGSRAPGKHMNSFHADNLENLMNQMENTQAWFFSSHPAHRHTNLHWDKKALWKWKDLYFASNNLSQNVLTLTICKEREIELKFNTESFWPHHFET